VDWYRLPEPTNDIDALLEGVARRIGAVVKGGELDPTMAAKFFLKQYRTGKLGRYTLDDLSPASIHSFFDNIKMFNATDKLMAGASRRQEKKLAKLEQRKQSRKASDEQS
jgi:ribosome biogenesis GTPase A